jgi:anionic cell wall polymer biosynthesis LytR-Cps2A-Psr (LCP) family protein
MSDNLINDKLQSKDQNKKSKKALIVIIGVLFSSLSLWLLIALIINNSHSQESNFNSQEKNSEFKEINSEDSTLRALKNKDTNIHIINTSNSFEGDIPFVLDNQGQKIKRVFTGRRINIAITGVDSRLGDNTKHADANHVLSFLIDSGKIEIYSVPRDTYVDAGYDDSTGQNKLTVLRAGKGRNAYLKELANIAGVDQIHYFVEFGFSQAMGILDFLGYKNANATLQVLRSRRALGGDDFQRCYNQGQFIRQTILSNHKRIDGVFGDLMLRGGLMIVESNLTTDKCKIIFAEMKKNGFSSNDDISVSVKPFMGTNFKIYDFTNQEVLEQLQSKTQVYYDKNMASLDTNHIDVQKSVSKKLNKAIQTASLDSAKKPANVVKSLRTLFDQRAWHQLQNKEEKVKLREDFKILLSSAYSKLKKKPESDYIITVIETEKSFLNK